EFVSFDYCNHTFANGDLPLFNLPEAGPNSPGDSLLNGGNPIVRESGYPVTLGCNGESASFETGNGTWNTTVFASGVEHDLDLFYINNMDELWIRTIDDSLAENLYEALNNTVIRLNITCGAGPNAVSCVEFMANFTEQTPYIFNSSFPFNATCYHGFHSGQLTPVFRVPKASPEGPYGPAPMSDGDPIIEGGAIDLGMGWEAGFDEDGNQLETTYWSSFWS
ncbi:unnamed protein product, partial [Discosporangium mesarthrocarpum]